ncbi:MAG: c-type cytochrome [Chloroflexota bacterium]
MKFRLLLFSLTALLLAACNMTLAQDVTPPPGAVQQAPAQAQPTHGPVYPAAAPNLQNGAAIYAEKCAACHGETGLADGVISAQLTGQGVAVPALGSPEIARKASPADWFLFVTLGNMEKFMPAFSSLDEQQRWDVVAYAQSLSVPAGQISLGAQLFDENCAACPTDAFSDQGKMAALSTEDLVSMLITGGQGIPALGETLSQDELNAVAAYLRSLTLGASSPTPVLATVTVTAEAAASVTPSPANASGTPSAEETPLEDGEQTEASPEATVQPAGFGAVSGKVVNGSGGDLPAGLPVTLRGFDHAMDSSVEPEEVVNQSAETDEDDSFRFENVEMPEGRIFFVEVEYQGIPFQSGLAFTDAGAAEVALPDVAVYGNTTQTGGLVIDELFVFTEFNADGTVRVFEQFYLTNQGSQAVTVETDGSSIPFLPMPEGGAGLAFQVSQDSAPLLSFEKGFAMPPSSERYGIIAFYTLPYEKKLKLTLPFALPVSAAKVVVPEGIEAESEQLTDEGVKEMQPGARFQVYSASALQGGESLEMTLSGKVKSASATSGVTDNQSLLIGIGAFGVVLILAGVWLYVRDRNKAEDEFIEEGEEDEFETDEEVMDAIIALDDLHRAGKIPDEAYQARRAELKERLKELS